MFLALFHSFHSVHKERKKNQKRKKTATAVLTMSLTCSKPQTNYKDLNVLKDAAILRSAPLHSTQNDTLFERETLRNDEIDLVTSVPTLIE